MVERGGVVQVFANDNAVATTSTFIDIKTRVNSAASDEAGLPGMAFHPQFATNHEVFLSYTGFGGPINLRSVIARFKSTDDGAHVRPAHATRDPQPFDQPYTNHNGGKIAFGPDGYLYWPVGDGGSGGDPQGNGAEPERAARQDPAHRRRTAATRTRSRRQPVRAAAAARRRSTPTACATRGASASTATTGELWVGDVGQNAWEEVDKHRARRQLRLEHPRGHHCYHGDPTCTGHAPGAIDPDRRVRPHDDGGNSITGGYVYRGSAHPGARRQLRLRRLTARGRIWAHRSMTPRHRRARSACSLDTSASTSRPSARTTTASSTSSTTASGNLSSWSPPAAVAGTSIPANALRDRLRRPERRRRQPAPGLIPYDVNSPLWSDGADKQRWLSLPDGRQDPRSTPTATGTCPIGTVLVKEFSVAGKRVETRLFMRHDDGDAGPATRYEWNDDQTDAVLLPDGKTEGPRQRQTWTLPEPRRVHAAATPTAAGRTLGLETGAAQPRPRVYANGRISNQLAHVRAHRAVRVKPLGEHGRAARTRTPAPYGERLPW